MATTKTCPNCASDIPGESKYCPQCGTPQALSCAACGHANAAGSRFCSQCGAKLSAAPAGAAAAPSPAPAPVSKAPPAARAANVAERRQITVMFCDLVGSTALSTQIDPEDLREIMAAYHKCAAETVTAFGGYVAKYMGDGVLVYFGYPEAHEDDAENAVRAARALIAAMTQLFAKSGRHQVRVGLATGLVVVGELLGTGEVQERNVVGETPNLAARLQAAAAPDTVVIDATTRRLAGELFEYEAVAPTALKGFAGPVTLWRVLRERTIASRFEALRAEARTPLVGREEEMDLLQRRWTQIKEGEGRVVLLAGEPGIGKSRLTAGLEDSLKEEPHVCLRYFCQPHHQGSALQPVIAQFQHAADFAPNDTADEKRAKIEALLSATSGDTSRQDAAPILELLGLAEARPDGASDPQRGRRLLMTALIRRLEALARKTPVLMLFEDMHWADPTSLELLTLIIEHLQKLPVLLVITFRPEYQPPWTGQPHVTMLTLNRLSQRERAALVIHITGGKALPSDLLDQIVDRTDGVPLFVEELTKAVLESEQLQEAGDQYVLDQPARPLAIPSTLQASLMARVDRLGSAREVLQIGAAIGRQFAHELVAAVAGLPDAILQDALARLAEAELVFIRGTPPNATYVFKHALVQDSAYSAMLRSRRQSLHASIATILEKRFPETVKTTPEVLAQQFELAGQSERAIAYWRQAGERDLRRFAMKEAIAHYSSALRVVTAMPQSRQREEVELGVRLGLGLATMMARGPAAPEAVAHYREALSLSQKLPQCGRERFLATWGVWFSAMVGGRSAEIEPLAEQLVTIARELDNPDLLLEAYHCKVPMTLRKPDFAAACEAAEEVIRLYDRERHREHAYFFGGHDSRMCARSFYAQALWGNGLFDQARDMAWKSIDDARELGHAFSIAHGLQRGGVTMMLLGDTTDCRAIADELYLLAERNKFPWQLSDATFFRGWLAALAGDTETGMGQMRHAVKQPYNPGYRAVFLLALAERELAIGEIDTAAATIEQAIAEMQTHANNFCRPDAIRLRGEALMAGSRDNGATAERMFREALALATTQSCRPLALRSALSLARLMAETNRRTEARDLLAPVYATFTEGFARPDLQAAKALLAELN
jgi:class 3 adenylate cyclase/tetratricopeptide (TPR) repeat protein